MRGKRRDQRMQFSGRHRLWGRNGRMGDNFAFDRQQFKRPFTKQGQHKGLSERRAAQRRLRLKGEGLFSGQRGVARNSELPQLRLQVLKAVRLSVAV